MLTTENIDFKLFPQKRNSHHSSAPILLRFEFSMQKNYRFVEYVLVKCFNKFVQPAVNARREGDENSISRVAAETRKLLSNSVYGHQIMDRSHHTVTKNLSDEKTHGAINTKLFKRLDHISDLLYEVKLVKAEI